MKIKLFEVRDSATFIPVLAVRLRSSERLLVGQPPTNALPYEAACYTTPATAESYEQEDYLLRRAGFCHIPEVILCRLECDGTERIASYDPFAWGNRTLTTAHRHIEKHWDTLESGAVIDVQFILKETDRPKVSERFSEMCLDRSGP